MDHARNAAAWLLVMAPLVGHGEVATDQRQVAIGYERLETLALRIADAVETNDEARAEQIRTAIGQARTAGVTERFDRVVALLERQRYQSARSDQQEIATQLEELLRLVMADPRESRMEEERQRLETLRREIRAALREQRSLRSLQGRGDTEQAAPRQEDLARKIERLREPAEEADRLAGREAQDAAKGPAPGETPPGQTETDGESSPGDAKSIAKRIEASSQSMRRASKKLAEQDESAAEEQRQAQRELEAAQREAEERLRQIREEQRQRRLASLAERFRRMHESQVGIVNDTEARIEAKGDRKKEATRAERLAASQLAQRESDVGQAAEQALRLVRADGSSLVFDDALASVIEDLRTAEERLKRGRVDGVTLEIERSAVEALAEMIEAVDESLDELEQQRGQQGEAGPPPPGGPQGLVSKIAELKMIRARQARLLRQTKAWREAVRAGDATPAEVAERLAGLANEQRGLAQAAEAVAKPGP
ncbi:hypothetical protein MalM25_09800 [Planctomycetes bacterium MalM25]|nr:hypothetical protein MalM25_09800 [Planctomycetes bacterium MalM25]